MKKPIVFEPLLALCVLALLLLMTMAAFAQQSAAPAPERPRQACAADYQKFCSDAQSGQGHVAQCMRQHEAQLSDTCKASMAAAKQQRAAKKSGAQQPAQ